ncbi:TIGR02587 family membrane protein [Pontibacter pamirensis]|nr:TIGR02587 family membrane protein [Pontibacter pamirensis]
MAQRFTTGRPVKNSLKEYARGIGFSFPLLYTMEIWWHHFPV